jgi:hypothetical protein
MRNAKAAFVIAVGAWLWVGPIHAQTIEGFTHAGEGCPVGSVGEVYNPTTGILTIIFDQYEANLNPQGASNPSTNCNVDVVIRVPPRLQVSWNRVQFLGYLNKPRGVTAELRRRYQYDINPPISQVRTWPGNTAFNGDFLEEDAFPGWSACRERVTASFTSRMALRGSSPQFSEMVMDRQHIQTKVILYFAYLPC